MEEINHLHVFYEIKF